MIRRLLSALSAVLVPDSFARDWYGETTSQAGHAAAVGMPAALALHGVGLPPALVPPAVALIYLGFWERLIQRGPDLRDSLTDTAHVATGATIITAALCWGYWPTVGALTVWAAMLAAGIWRRL